MRKWLLFLLLLAGGAPFAQATSLLPMYLDDLTAASQTVVYGRVIASRAEWDENRQWIYTIYTVQPAEYLKGALGPVFELREPGGELDGLWMTIPSVPSFQVGQEAVLFVWTDGQGRHQVAGFEQGAVPVAADAETGVKTALRGIRLGYAPKGPAALSAGPATSRSLPQFFDQVRASVARTRHRLASQ